MSMWSWLDKAFDVGPAYAAPLRLVRAIEAPSRDEFAAWRDDPTTRFVMHALQRNADECRDEWLRKSWDGGQADQRTLDGLRERADALLGFTADYEAFCETLNLEPEQEEQAA
jgi:hypothetical protein